MFLPSIYPVSDKISKSYHNPPVNEWRKNEFRSSITFYMKERFCVFVVACTLVMIPWNSLLYGVARVAPWVWNLGTLCCIKIMMDGLLQRSFASPPGFRNLGTFCHCRVGKWQWVDYYSVALVRDSSGILSTKRSLRKQLRKDKDMRTRSSSRQQLGNLQSLDEWMNYYSVALNSWCVAPRAWNLGTFRHWTCKRQWWMNILGTCRRCKGQCMMALENFGLSTLAKEFFTDKRKGHHDLASTASNPIRGFFNQEPRRWKSWCVINE